MMTNQEPKLVFLDAESAGLIVLAPTSVWFQVQTGGYACFQDRAEGFYVPLSYEVVDHYLELNRYFIEHSPEMGGEGIDQAAATFIDAELSRLPGHAGITVDRDRLAASREAWVHVLIGEPTLGLFFRGFSSSLAAILVWPNSD
jgi:hypothetical protein